jgi:uncharacterized protein YyaL (SSP411 family)
LVLFLNQSFYEVAILGNDHKTMAQEIAKVYIPNSILVGAQQDGTISLLKNRAVPGKTLAYVCIEGACKLPVSSSDDVLEQFETMQH